MGPWRLPSVRWPLLLLLTSIGFTTLGVFEANRAIRSQRRVAEHALHDYAGFVAWSYEQHLRELFTAGTQEVLGAVNHGKDMHMVQPVPPATKLPEYLPWDRLCYCHRARNGPTPEMFFGYVLGSDTLGVARNTHPDPTKGWEVDRPMPVELPGKTRRVEYSAAERKWINDTLTKQIHNGKGFENGRFPIVIARYDSTPRFLVYTLMPTTWGDTLVYGAEYTISSITKLLANVMDHRRLLPPTFAAGHPVREMVQIQVSNLGGDVLFESEPVSEWNFDDTTRTPAAFGSLLVRARINPNLAGSLVIGGLPKSRLPFLLGLLAVSAMLSLVAMGQMRREGELARLRADFVANISHELRTPLAQMRLYLETLRLGRFKTEEQRRWSLDNVERETTRLSHLVERVLRFSRTGRPDDESREHVDAGSEVKRIVEEFQPLATARGTHVTVDVEPVPPLILAPAALRHIVLNLLDNAVKYGPTEQTVRVRVHAVAGEVQIMVADQGPGVPTTDRASVWRAYHRGTTAGHTAGSGLGLSIVHDVVVQHGGRAWIADPAEGSGAVFVIALPAAASAPHSLTATSPSASKASDPVLR